MSKQSRRKQKASKKDALHSVTQVTRNAEQRHQPEDKPTLDVTYGEPKQPKARTTGGRKVVTNLRRFGLAGVFGYIAGVASMLSFLPLISVDPVSQLEAVNALSTPFVLSNESYLPIYVTSITCQFDELKWSDGSVMERATSPYKIGRFLWARERMTIPCLNDVTVLSHYPLQKGTITFVVNLLWPFRGITRKFGSATTSSGTVWLPIIGRTGGII